MEAPTSENLSRMDASGRSSQQSNQPSSHRVHPSSHKHPHSSRTPRHENNSESIDGSGAAHASHHSHNHSSSHGHSSHSRSHGHSSRNHGHGHAHSSSHRHDKYEMEVPYGMSGYKYPPSNAYGTVDSIPPLEKPSFKSKLIRTKDSLGIPRTFLPISKQYPDHLFGLQGMLGILRNRDPTSKMVSIGMDLTKLGGLDLNSSEPELYHRFISPWADDEKLEHAERSRKHGLPQSYLRTKRPEHFKASVLRKFHTETLFYIFYSMPNDHSQLYAADMLYERNWSYHSGMQIWLTQRIVERNKADNSPTVLELQYFDIATWACRSFFHDYSHLSWDNEKEKLVHRTDLESIFMKNERAWPLEYENDQHPPPPGIHHTANSSDGRIERGHESNNVSVLSMYSSQLPQKMSRKREGDTIYSVLTQKSNGEMKASESRKKHDRKEHSSKSTSERGKT